MAKTDVAVGDVFAIPLVGGGFGVGRIVHIADRWRLAQFFRVRLNKPVFFEELIHLPDVMPVHNVVTSLIEDGSWPVMQRRSLDGLPDLDSLVFYRGLADSRSYVSLKNEAVEGSPEWSASTMPQFAEFIASQLDNSLRRAGC